MEEEIVKLQVLKKVSKCESHLNHNESSGDLIDEKNQELEVDKLKLLPHQENIAQ